MELQYVKKVNIWKMLLEWTESEFKRQREVNLEVLKITINENPTSLLSCTDSAIETHRILLHQIN